MGFRLLTREKKKVPFKYGCEELGYLKGEILVDKNASDEKIEEQLVEFINNLGLYVSFETESGFHAII